ncbi:hypothetical protein LWI29_028363 [Acer saccharum]|uniref:Uncharacterized protein n=1 Tax=Acer saccharum TaxID=4024 RepID=A0AA39VQL5_ACESA|nr:hypothetical protein LWI29_028363 [Acer saccharum]
MQIPKYNLEGVVIGCPDAKNYNLEGAMIGCPDAKNIENREVAKVLSFVYDLCKTGKLEGGGAVRPIGGRHDMLGVRSRSGVDESADKDPARVGGPYNPLLTHGGLTTVVSVLVGPVS